jgi:hypothetical protein
MLAMAAFWLAPLLGADTHHHLLVRHAACLEHGEEVEAQAIASPSSEARISGGAQARAEAGHPLCRMLRDSPDEAPFTGSDALAALLVEPDATQQAPAIAPRAGAALYRIAPKSSPPA